MTVREYLEQLRTDGFGLYQAMDILDRRAASEGYAGPAFYSLLCDVYKDWTEPRKRKGRYVKSEHTQAEWELKKEQYSNRCFYCGKVTEKLTKDHVIPVSQGGSDKIDNIVPACWPCNYRKRAKDITAFKNGAMLKLL